MAKAAKPFSYRGGWRMQVTLANGLRPHKDFDRYADAVQWGAEQLANANSAHEPVLGGPKRATLAQALVHYAEHHSLLKGGVDAELNRINHYLAGAGMPLLKKVRNAHGAPELATHQPKVQPAAWQRHNDRRREARAGTYAAIAALAIKRCSEICAADIRALHTQMKKDGLSDSTIQKELAMLKVLFNTAAREWGWAGFENPCIAVKLGKSARRFVFLTPEQRAAVDQALGECDNPYFWPLVTVARESTLRLDSLMQMRWADVDVEHRVAVLPSKTGRRNYVFSQTAQQVLEALPHSPCGRVFPMSKNAVKMMWNRVREKAGMPQLQFRDLRHLGATDWVRRGLNTHQLAQVLGHSSIQTAQFYVDLVGMDVMEALDRASTRAAAQPLPSTGQLDAKEQISLRRGERMRKVTAARTQARKTGGEAPPQPAPQRESEPAPQHDGTPPSNVLPFQARRAA
ncbi:MAG: site-specific integrase [Proteobacteria bacterium]|nr:site-specific integrase [Pseudomonadota bacterium]